MVTTDPDLSGGAIFASVHIKNPLSGSVHIFKDSFSSAPYNHGQISAHGGATLCVADNAYV